MLGAAGSPARCLAPTHRTEDAPMSWKKPRVTEISLAMEINCYACAEA
ncbi:pyrroloquinoline quinone precursor peptide PqqA [Caldovatus sp. SYSU G05006]|uniref:Coenzyme PQQ synthesis protein A n=1 Tax=Caldovatus aquaticus TaxID=2865671 RepID=A0ABS7F5U4_9PROT|nr:pyrroloquinoline quinone precursor peptide PqqA [Caldovatus aquaticus]